MLKKLALVTVMLAPFKLMAACEISAPSTDARSCMSTIELHRSSEKLPKVTLTTNKTATFSHANAVLLSQDDVAIELQVSLRGEHFDWLGYVKPKLSLLEPTLFGTPISGTTKRSKIDTILNVISEVAGDERAIVARLKNSTVRITFGPAVDDSGNWQEWTAETIKITANGSKR